MNKLDAVGKFKCRVPEAKSYLGQSKNGKACVAIPLEVIEGDHEGEQITKYLFLTDTVGKDRKMTFDRTIENLADVFGFDGDLEALHRGEISFEGMECRIVTEKDAYEGEERVVVAWLNHVDSTGGLKPLDEAGAQSLLQKMNDRSKAVAKKTLEGKPQQAASDTSTESTKEIPF